MSQTNSTSFNFPDALFQSFLPKFVLVHIIFFLYNDTSNSVNAFSFCVYRDSREENDFYSNSHFLLPRVKKHTPYSNIKVKMTNLSDSS